MTSLTELLKTESPTTLPATDAARAPLGERLRQLRIAAGLTQTELAGDRFSKEYVSQIERNKTRPTGDTVEWLAGRLGVDSAFLSKGVSVDQRVRVEAGLARAEALTDDRRFDEATELYSEMDATVFATGASDLELRAALGESRARLNSGCVTEAIEVLTRARALAEGPEFTDNDRAAVLAQLGGCRYQLSSTTTAVGLFNEALALTQSAVTPDDRLRAKIFEWRSRCYRRLRDFPAAREDIERAVELSQGADDRRAAANAFFQASIVAEREGHWVAARSYAERAKAQYEELADEANVGRLLNNLGGLNFLLGNPEKAKRHLKDAFRVAIDVGSDADAAQAVSSLAQIHLRTGEIGLAEEQSRHALKLLDGRIDFLDEIGNAQLVLGRSLLEQDRLEEAELQFKAADASFEQLSSVSHRAAAWVAQGDLAARRGEDAPAARLYRRAAEALQDFRF